MSSISLRSLTLLTAIVTFCSFQGQNTVSGVVTEKGNGASLPGATVQVLGTSSGTSTDVDGRFTIEAGPTDTLKVGFVGFAERIVPVSGRSELSISLSVAKETLGEVVVTALGISREEKSLGYSVGRMDVKTASTVRDPNLVNSMQGKIAGVDITKTSGGPGASSRILIRGNSSIVNNNQPLVVIDGIPMDNTTIGTGGTWGGIDYGSPISDINPDDIEDLTVLKGPSAAALYGSRALNGVILITTKSGAGTGKEWRFSVNSTSSVETAYILKEFQDVYGAGTRGQFEYGEDSIPFFNTERPSTPTYSSSWGPAMQGQTYRDWNGELTTFSPQPDNYKDFFQVGTTFTNNVSASKGGKFPLRISFTDLRNRGITPTSTFQRQNLNLSNGGPIGKKTSYAVKFTYADQEAFNRVNQSNGHNASRNIIMMPRSVSAESLSRFEDAQGYEQTWYTDWGWVGNPYFTYSRNLNYDDRQRQLGNLSLTHELKDWLQIMGRVGIDHFDESRHERIATRSFTVPNGQFSETDIDFFEINADYLITAERTWNKGLSLTASLGGNTMYQKRQFDIRQGSNLVQHAQYTLDNTPAENRVVRDELYERRMNSAYASALLSYQDHLFLEVTGRNDWSSTLPLDNNSYFYPSISLSYVLSEHLESVPSWLSLAKFRASIAEVGQDSDPYLLELYYDTLTAVNGVQLAEVQNPFPLVDLEPEKKRSYELGADVRFFSNRLGLDITYYYESTSNQIITNSSVSATSGFRSATVNAGEIVNRGIELLLNATPIKTDRFSWNTTLSFMRNVNEVVSLNSNGQGEVLGDQWRVNIMATPGLPYGAIFGYGIQRDENGTPLLNADGTYLRTENQILLGNVNPDWKMGVSNGISFKNWNMGFLIDIQKGGDLYSATNMYMHGYSGNAAATLEGRAEWYASEEARVDAGVAANSIQGDDYIMNWTPTGGYGVNGVYAEGTFINGEDVSGHTASRFIDPQTYWSQFAEWTNEIHEPFVYDASYVKLREVSITYSFKEGAFGKRIRNATVTLMGRNLWLIHSNIPNVDPEAAYTNGNGQGVEYATYPITRTIGINLRADF